MTLKSIILGFTALVSSASFATTDSISIENENFKPESLVTGEWGGEPIVGDVSNYGVGGLNTVFAFFEESELENIVSSILNFETEQDIHAVHLHGTGTSSNIIELHGYTVVFGNELTETYQMETYNRTERGFVINDEFSSTARGALDCGSAAKLAILHGPAIEPLVSITLGKTEYSGSPQSEEKFSSYLTNATALLARERGSLMYVAPFSDMPSIGHCGNSSSCEKGSSTCNILQGAICN